MFDPSGKLIVAEEGITIDVVPPAVKAAFEARGKVLKVESVTMGKTITYEAQVEKNGNKSEVVVDAAGKPVKR